MNSGLLLDTNILSIFSPDQKKKPSGAMKEWFREHGKADLLYLSAITIAEIERGMRNLHRRGGTERAKLLNGWLDSLLDSFGDRILDVNPVVARVAGALEDAATAKGVHPGLGDVIIAATAKAYGLTIITANLKHFLPLGAACDLPVVLNVENEVGPQTP